MKNVAFDAAFFLFSIVEIVIKKRLISEISRFFITNL